MALGTLFVVRAKKIKFSLVTTISQYKTSNCLSNIAAFSQLNKVKAGKKRPNLSLSD